MKWLAILCLLLVFSACRDNETPLTAQLIVDKAIDNSCNGNCGNAKIDFTFREGCYISERNGGGYRYERITSDSTGVTRDILSNSGFKRYRNDTLIHVPDSMITRYSNSVNSVHYFAQLPFGLNDDAVQKELLGDAIVKGQPYFEVGVSFKQEGGGTDFQDQFVYWVHKKRFTVDYLAYSYETDGGGIRFREAYNAREVNGIRFVDYNNYKPTSKAIELTHLDELYEAGALQLLSKIETESVGVELIKAGQKPTIR